MASCARRISSASGLYMTTSMPETIFVRVEIGMSGKIWLAVLMKVTYAAYPRLRNSKWYCHTFRPMLMSSSYLVSRW